MKEPIITETANTQKNQAEDAFVEEFAASEKGDRRGQSARTPEPDPIGTPPETTTEDPTAGQLTEDPVDATGSDDGATGSDDQTQPEDAGELDPTQPEPERSAEEADLKAKFAEALKANGANLTLDDVPAEARPVVEKKIKNLEAGFTRAMQQLRAEQQEAIKGNAELSFQRERPVDFIVTLLQANPQLAEDVNSRLEEFEKSPIARDYHARIVADERAKALQAETQRLTEADQKAERADAIERAGRAAAQAAGVPFELGVEEAIVAHLLQHGDITDQQILSLAESKAKAYRNTVRATTRQASQQYVEAKVRDRTPAVRVLPGQGRAPAPAARPKPLSDDEFIERMAAQL